ncbi:type II toxin-antitoxin system VapC family toxin [Spirulina subsalsa]|uniref:type II toxin-antitoxin system VapC family toxin n=1 Tax=Spirulina subsalsa TaxID=54311 RepID=UPI0002EDA8E1|nr:PIN domain-containing protein [Spirulina subsalsa]
MLFLVDTNILLRSADSDHPMYEDAINSVSILKRQKNQLYIMPQNLIEFWNVCTRPKEKNGLGYSISETQEEIKKVKAFFILLSDHPNIYSEWERLVRTYQVKGVNVHDARLVAAMLVHNLTHILTFNSDDFSRFSEIIVVNPKAEVLNRYL